MFFQPFILYGLYGLQIDYHQLNSLYPHIQRFSISFSNFLRRVERNTTPISNTERITNVFLFLQIHEITKLVWLQNFSKFLCCFVEIHTHTHFKQSFEIVNLQSSHLIKVSETLGSQDTCSRGFSLDQKPQSILIGQISQ